MTDKALTPSTSDDAPVTRSTAARDLAFTAGFLAVAYFASAKLPREAPLESAVDLKSLYDRANFFITRIAIPIMFLDFFVSVFRKDGHHRLRDSGVNLLVGGVRGVVEPLVILSLHFAIYQFIYERVGLRVDLASPRNWVIAILLVDLGYYWDHRISHKVPFMWANHSIHHSSEELNFFTASRGSWIEGIYRWIFQAPIAALGFPPMMMIFVFRVLRALQIFQHTDRYVGDWPRLEKALATPEFHRIHHAVQTHYHDQNYGGVFSVWDHIYRTSTRRKPGEKLRYGVTTPAVNLDQPFSVLFSPLRQWARGVAGGISRKP